MVEPRRHWRFDRRIAELVCEHGVGHPDPDDPRIKSGSDSGIHGCDGCCNKWRAARKETT